MSKLSKITVAQRKRLASKAGTSDAVVRNIQAGRRRASVDMAERIEKAAVALDVDVRREDLCEACGRCYAMRAWRRAPPKGRKP